MPRAVGELKPYQLARAQAVDRDAPVLSEGARPKPLGYGMLRDYKPVDDEALVAYPRRGEDVQRKARCRLCPDAASGRHPVPLHCRDNCVRRVRHRSADGDRDGAEGEVPPYGEASATYVLDSMRYGMPFERLRRAWHDRRRCSVTSGRPRERRRPWTRRQSSRYARSCWCLSESSGSSWRGGNDGRRWNARRPGNPSQRPGLAS